MPVKAPFKGDIMCSTSPLINDSVLAVCWHVAPSTECWVLIRSAPNPWRLAAEGSSCWMDTNLISG